MKMNFKEAYHDACSTVAAAARLGNVESLKVLLEEGKPYDVKDNRGWTCIHEAANSGHVDCLVILLELDDVDVDLRTFEWETPLMLACEAGHAKCVECLIAHGAEVNAQTHDEESPLIKAVKENQCDCVQILIDKEADVTQRYFTEDTPLHIAVSSDCDMRIVTLLVNAGAKLKAVNEHQLTPLFLAAQFRRLDYLKYFIGIAKSKGQMALKDYIEMSASDGCTPLYIAAQNSFADGVQVLLENDADPLKGPYEIFEHVNQAACGDCSLPLYPIQAAIAANSFECYQLLIGSLDEVLDQYDYRKRCSEAFEYHPFVLAQQHDDLKIFQTLVERIQKALKIDLPNVFKYQISIPTACFYLKVSRMWALKNYARLVCQQSMWTFEHWKNLIYLVFLRFGKSDCLLTRLHSLRYILWVDNQDRNTDRLRLFAFIKYLRGRCKAEYCGRCAFDLRYSQLSNVNYLIQLCLTPFISHPGVLRDMEEESKHKEKDQVMDQIEHYEQLRESISSMLVQNSLQHNCRLAIVFRLANNNNYNSAAIETFNLPKLLKDYLEFREFDVIGKHIMDGFAKLDSVEKEEIDKGFIQACKLYNTSKDCSTT